MSSSPSSEIGIKIFGIISFLFGFCLLLVCCGSYIVNKKRSHKQNQIHFTNHQNLSEPNPHVFTIDVTDTLSPNIDPPAYVPTQEQLPGS